MLVPLHSPLYCCLLPEAAGTLMSHHTFTSHSPSLIYSGLDLNSLTMYKTSGHVLCTYMYIMTHHPTMRAQQVRGVRGCVAWSIKDNANFFPVYCLLKFNAACTQQKLTREITCIPPQSLTGPDDLGHGLNPFTV